MQIDGIEVLDMGIGEAAVPEEGCCPVGRPSPYLEPE